MGGVFEALQFDSGAEGGRLEEGKALLRRARTLGERERGSSGPPAAPVRPSWRQVDIEGQVNDESSLLAAAATSGRRS